MCKSLNKDDDCVLFISVGTPTPDRNGFGSAALIATDDVRLLIDCGPAAVWKLAQYDYMPTDIDAVLLTHLHFDHCSDLPCFLLVYWDQNVLDERRIKLIGPPELMEMIDHLIGKDGAFNKDIQARMNAAISTKTFANRGGSLPRKWPEAEVITVYDKNVRQIAHVKIQVTATEHVRPYLNSYAYRFDFNGKSIVFTGDTGSVDQITSLANDCDLLVVNCWNARADIRDEQDKQAMSRVEEAIDMAVLSNAKILCLNHMGLRSGQNGIIDTSQVMKEVQQHYGGQLYIAQEGLRISI